MVIVGITVGGMDVQPSSRSEHAAECVNINGNEDQAATHLFRLAFVISFRRAAPSRGLRSSNAHSKSSDTLQEDMSDPAYGGVEGDSPHASTIIVKFCSENTRD